MLHDHKLQFESCTNWNLLLATKYVGYLHFIPFQLNPDDGLSK